MTLSTKDRTYKSQSHVAVVATKLLVAVTKSSADAEGAHDAPQITN